MAYPNKPDNDIIVYIDNKPRSLFDTFGCIVLDGYTINPPKPKTTFVEIPGGDGSLDLTDALTGYCVFEDREATFPILAVNVGSIESFKTNLLKALQGKLFKYEITMDPGFYYTGRFTLTDFSSPAVSNYDNAVFFTIEIKAEPYKKRDPQVLKIDAIGGVELEINNGRMVNIPVVETEGVLKVIKDNKQITLTPGTWSLTAMPLMPGVNKMYFSSYLIRNMTWGQIKEAGVTWGEFKKKPLYEWYKTDVNGMYVIAIWNDLANKAWTEIGNFTWANFSYDVENTENITPSYLKFEIGEL